MLRNITRTGSAIHHRNQFTNKSSETQLVSLPDDSCAMESDVDIRPSHVQARIGTTFRLTERKEKSEITKLSTSLRSHLLRINTRGRPPSSTVRYTHGTNSVGKSEADERGSKRQTVHSRKEVSRRNVTRMSRKCGPDRSLRNFLPIATFFVRPDRHVSAPHTTGKVLHRKIERRKCGRRRGSALCRARSM